MYHISGFLEDAQEEYAITSMKTTPAEAYAAFKHGPLRLFFSPLTVTHTLSQWQILRLPTLSNDQWDLPTTLPTLSENQDDLLHTRQTNS